MSPLEKSRGIIDGIVWNKENRPFTLDEIYKALEKADAICRYGIRIPPKDYLRVLEEYGVMIYSFKDETYKRADDWEEKIKTVETFDVLRGHL